MADQGLVNYIQNRRSEGADDETIKHELSGNNDADAIDTALGAASSGQQHENGSADVTIIRESDQQNHWFYELFRGRIDGFRWFFGGLINWLFFNALALLVAIVAIHFAQIDPLAAATGMLFLFIAVWGVSAIIGVSLTVRRLHDKGHSGWGAVLLLIPIINIVLFLYLCIPAQFAPNRFGKRDERSFFNAVYNTNRFSNTVGLVLVVIALGVHGFYATIADVSLRVAGYELPEQNDAALEREIKALQPTAQTYYRKNRTYDGLCDSDAIQTALHESVYPNTTGQAGCGDSDDNFFIFGEFSNQKGACIDVDGYQVAQGSFGGDYTCG